MEPHLKPGRSTASPEHRAGHVLDC